jgi:hypothetical protein
VAGWCFSADTPVSSRKKMSAGYITEMLMNVALNNHIPSIDNYNQQYDILPRKTQNICLNK